MRIAKLAILLILAGAVPAAAQNRKREISKEHIELKGLVGGVQAGVLQIVADREQEGRTWQEPWLARPAPGAKIDIAGYADREILRPGLVVRLVAEFDLKTGAATEPVTELAIVTPRFGDQVGIFPDDPAEPTERKKGPPPKTAKLRILDAVTGVKENTLFFKKYHVEVSPDAVIKVDIADPSALSRGDKINTMTGWYVKGRPGAVFIEQMDATLVEPLGQKKKTTAGTATRAGEKGEKGDKGEKSDIFDIAGEDGGGKKGVARKQSQAESGKKPLVPGGETKKATVGKRAIGKKQEPE